MLAAAHTGWGEVGVRGGDVAHGGRFGGVRAPGRSFGRFVRCWLFTVKTSSTLDSQFEQGGNTNWQFEGSFRCPTWSDEWAGTPNQPRKVSVYLVTAANLAYGSGWCVKNYTVTATWQWSFATDGSYPTPLSDSTIYLWIGTNGYPLDVDALWVGSGI